MNNKTNIHFLTISAILLALPYTAQALPLLPVPLTLGDISGSYTLSSWDYNCQCYQSDYQTFTGPIAHSNTLPLGPVIGSFTVTTSPTPTINGTATLIGGVANVFGGEYPLQEGASMYTAMNYSFEITGPTATASVLVNAQGGMSITSLIPNTNATAAVTLQIYDVSNGPATVNEIHQVGPSSGSSDSFTIARDYTFSTNTLYHVDMMASLSGAVYGSNTLSLSAFIDPSFTIDGPNAGDYGIFFSDGFGPSPVPIPAALPLFTTGLGALGLLGWRRKQKSAALTA